jgi:hypothetical protein
MTCSIAPVMAPESRPSAATTPIVMTARTTPYSAIVCPSSRVRRVLKKLVKWFTSLPLTSRTRNRALKLVEADSNVRGRLDGESPEIRRADVMVTYGETSKNIRRDRSADWLS